MKEAPDTCVRRPRASAAAPTPPLVDFVHRAGRAEARVFLNEVLPVAPDIPIQVAHLAGTGPRLDAGSKEALAVFATPSRQPTRARGIFTSTSQRP